MHVRPGVQQPQPEPAVDSEVKGAPFAKLGTPWPERWLSAGFGLWTSSKKDSNRIGLCDTYCCCEQRTYLRQMPPLRPDAWQTPNDQSSQSLLATPHDSGARQSDSTLVPSGRGSPLRARLLAAFAGARQLHFRRPRRPSPRHLAGMLRSPERLRVSRQTKAASARHTTRYCRNGPGIGPREPSRPSRMRMHPATR